MNRFRSNLAVAVMAIGLSIAAIPVKAQTRQGFAETGTGTTLASVVVPLGLGRPVVTYVSATSDKAASVLQFKKCTAGAQTLTLATNASQAVVHVPASSFWAANDVGVLWHKSVDSYERVTVSATNGLTALTLSANLGTAVVAGDQLFKMSNAGTIPVGNATKEITTVGVYHSPPGLPVVIDLDGTSACKINLATGYFSQ
jgi:hypothetical protein